MYSKKISFFKNWSLSEKETNLILHIFQFIINSSKNYKVTISKALEKENIDENIIFDILLLTKHESWKFWKKRRFYNVQNSRIVQKVAKKVS